MVTAIERGTAPAVDDSELRTRVAELLNRHPSVGMAFGVVRHGRHHRRPRFVPDLDVFANGVRDELAALSAAQLTSSELLDLHRVDHLVELSSNVGRCCREPRRKDQIAQAIQVEDAHVFGLARCLVPPALVQVKLGVVA